MAESTNDGAKRHTARAPGAGLAVLTSHEPSTDDPVEAALADFVKLGVDDRATRLIVGTLALRSPGLLALPHDEAIRRQLETLKLVADVDAVSVWTVELG